jgi:hypothetical protein
MNEICMHPILIGFLVLVLLFIAIGYRETLFVKLVDSYMVQPISKFLNKGINAILTQKNKIINQQPVDSVQQPVDIVQQPVDIVQQPTETFSNDLVRDDVDIISYNDYESALKEMSLENEVAEQHKKYVGELHHRIGGTSSRSSVRDDNVDTVPYWGLKRPQYQKLNPNRPGAVFTTSEVSADQLADYKNISWN